MVSQIGHSRLELKLNTTSLGGAESIYILSCGFIFKYKRENVSINLKTKKTDNEDSLYFVSFGKEYFMLERDQLVLNCDHLK